MNQSANIDMTKITLPIFFVNIFLQILLKEYMKIL